MNKLWAPWRMQYIQRKKTKKCIFCKLFKSKNYKKNFVFLRSRYCFAVLNTFPYNNGHTLIVSNRHLKSLEALKEYELLDITTTLIKAKSKLERILKPNGFNIGINIGEIAGAGIINHIHIHLVPRWKGDTNFMPIIANTKIISQSLNELYCRLKKENL